MKNALTDLLDSKEKFEKKYVERELMLMDDEVGKYLFAVIIQEMAELRLAICIIKKEIEKELNKHGTY
jgi:hypothetical protein